MATLSLFRVGDGKATLLEHRSVRLERELQKLFEDHLEDLLAVRFLATEFKTDAAHGGRIDTLGLDENSSPVIVEYKRSANENVINQGLFYLDWLMNHKKDFSWLVLNKLGREQADAIDWTSPRLVCVAESFSRYDGYAVNQMSRGIELLEYRLYEGGLLAIERVNDATPASAEVPRPPRTRARTPSVASGSDDESAVAEWAEDGVASVTPVAAAPTNTVRAALDAAKQEVRDVFDALVEHMQRDHDDVELRYLRVHFAFTKLKSFVTGAPRRGLVLWLRLDPDSVDLGRYAHLKARDVRSIGHWGVGDLEITLTSLEDFEAALPLLERAYNEN